MAEFVGRIALDDTDFERGRLRAQQGTRQFKREFDQSIGSGRVGGGGIGGVALGVGGAFAAIGVAAVVASAAIGKGIEAATQKVAELHRLLPELDTEFSRNEASARSFARVLGVEVASAYEAVSRAAKGFIDAQFGGPAGRQAAGILGGGAIGGLLDRIPGLGEARDRVQGEVRDAVSGRVEERRLKLEAELLRAQGKTREAARKEEEALHIQRLRNIQEFKRQLDGLLEVGEIAGLTDLADEVNKANLSAIDRKKGDRQFRGVEAGLLSAGSRGVLVGRLGVGLREGEQALASAEREGLRAKDRAQRDAMINHLRQIETHVKHTSSRFGK